VVQGLGAGMILPLTQIILAQAAGPRRFGRIMALVAVPGNLVPVVGPVLGGLVLHHLHWRWIFLINAPVCVLAIGLAWRGLPPGPARGRQPLRCAQPRRTRPRPAQPGRRGDRVRPVPGRPTIAVHRRRRGRARARRARPPRRVRGARPPRQNYTRPRRPPVPAPPVRRVGSADVPVRSRALRPAAPAPPLLPTRPWA